MGIFKKKNIEEQPQESVQQVVVPAGEQAAQQPQVVVVPAGEQEVQQVKPADYTITAEQMQNMQPAAQPQPAAVPTTATPTLVEPGRAELVDKYNNGELIMIRGPRDEQYAKQQQIAPPAINTNMTAEDLAALGQGNGQGNGAPANGQGNGNGAPANGQGNVTPADGQGNGVPADGNAIQAAMPKRGGNDGNGQGNGQGNGLPYLADWGNVRFGDVYRNGNIPATELLADRNRWARENGKEPLDVFEFMAAINGKDANKGYADQEKDAKKLKRQQQWQQIGNLLSHIANLTGTIFGAPNIKLESGKDLTERQQKLLKEAEREIKAGNINVLNNIYKDAADRRARDLNDANIAYRNSAREDNRRKADADVKQKDAAAERNKAAAKKAEEDAKYVADKNKREQDEAPLKQDYIKAGVNQRKAAASNQRASAASHYASAKKTNTETRTRQQEADRWKTFNRNRRRYPEEFKKWKKENKIMDKGTNFRAWNKDHVDNFNGYIATKQKGRRGKTSKLLD